MKAWHHIERAADLAGTQPATVFRDLLELKLLANGAEAARCWLRRS